MRAFEECDCVEKQCTVVVIDGSYGKHVVHLDVMRSARRAYLD